MDADANVKKTCPAAVVAVKDFGEQVDAESMHIHVYIHTRYTAMDFGEQVAAYMSMLTQRK